MDFPLWSPLRCHRREAAVLPCSLCVEGFVPSVWVLAGPLPRIGGRAGPRPLRARAATLCVDPCTLSTEVEVSIQVPRGIPFPSPSCSATGRRHDFGRHADGSAVLAFFPPIHGLRWALSCDSSSPSPPESSTPLLSLLAHRILLSGPGRHGSKARRRDSGYPHSHIAQRRIDEEGRAADARRPPREGLPTLASLFVPSGIQSHDATHCKPFHVKTVLHFRYLT
jgi:hypothetical protein